MNRLPQAEIVSGIEFSNACHNCQSKNPDVDYSEEPCRHINRKEISLVFLKPRSPEDLEEFLVNLVLSYVKPERAFVSKFNPTLEKVREHYSPHKGKPYYEDLVEFTCSGGALTFIILCGEGVVSRGRQILEVIRRAYANPNVIRENVIHASDSIKEGRREADLWVKEAEHWASYKY